MKLAPVLLLAPDPEPRAPSRRTFVRVVAGAFAAGAVGGFGFGLVSRPRAAPVDAAGRSIEVDWALRLQRDDVEALARERHTFYVVYASHPEAAAELAEGFARLVDAVLAGFLERDLAGDVARDLIAWCDSGDESLRACVGPHRAALQRASLRRIVR